jgi:N-acetylglutamate synthase-like GNAT family acetyltransferase
VKTSPLSLRPHDDRPPEVTVRPGRAEDHPAICQLLVTAHRQYQWVMPPEAYMVFVTNLVDIEAHARTAEVLVAERDGGVIGAASYQRQGGAPWPWRWAAVRALAMDPRVHRQGVGGALLEACVARALGNRVAGLGVHAAPFMDRTIELFEERGFRRRPPCDVDLTRTMGLPAPGPVPLLAYALPVG